MKVDEGYNVDYGGIDLAMRRSSTVYSAGHGTVSDAGADAYLGNYVTIDHGDGKTTTYGHLLQEFVSVGDQFCRATALGYSDNTGLWSSGDHLHFQGPDSPDQFVPMYGHRDGTATPEYSHDDFEFNPYDSSCNTPYQVSELAHVGVSTNAYTVDDTQVDEFTRDGGRWYEHTEDGFGYFNKDLAHMWYTIKNTESVESARWNPDLPVVGLWKVYVYYSAVHSTYDRAHYRVSWYNPATGWNWTDMYLDQNNNADTWVRLSNSNYTIFQTYAVGQDQLTVTVFDDCSPCTSQNPQLAVDAVLFEPLYLDDCEP